MGLQAYLLQVVGSNPTGAIQHSLRRSSMAERVVSSTLVALRRVLPTKSPSFAADRSKVNARWDYMDPEVAGSSPADCPFDDGRSSTGRAPGKPQGVVSSPLVTFDRSAAEHDGSESDANTWRDYTNTNGGSERHVRCKLTLASYIRGSTPLPKRSRLHFVASDSLPSKSPASAADRSRVNAEVTPLVAGSTPADLHNARRSSRQSNAPQGVVSSIFVTFDQSAAKSITP